MTGKEYADLISAYITSNFSSRGILVYREISIGKSIIGKNRRIDVFVVSDKNDRALAIECKYQAGQGTTDEKIPYALDDIASMWIPSCLVYAGDGFSEGVTHMLRASKYAAYCLPDPNNLHLGDTKELNHIIASVFHWWDIMLDEQHCFQLDRWEKPGM